MLQVSRYANGRRAAVAVASGLVLWTAVFASDDTTVGNSLQTPPSTEADATDLGNEGLTDQKGAIITITGTISDVTTNSIERRVATARDQGVDVIIFEVNTPGGYVTSALDICDYIKNLEGVKTVAWINTQAYSAGSMISVACDEIVMARASVLGDCGVILAGPTGPQEVPEQIRAKAESPVLEQFRDSASKNGYDVLLCESMVIKEMEIYWVENTKTGERRFVNLEDKEELIEAESKSTTILGVEIPSLIDTKPEWKLVETYYDPINERDETARQPIVRSTELLTLSQSRAHAFGFSQGIVTGESDLRDRYGLAGEIQRIEFTWSEIFTRWLTSMPVRGFLLIIVFLGAYVEFNTPGVGVPGLVALIALGIFLGAPYLTGLANVWEIAIILLGFVLIGLEIFVIPGFGVAGISGIILVIIGLLATFMPEEPGRFPIHWPQLVPSVDGLKQGIQTVGAALGLSMVGMFLLSKYLPHMPYLRGLVPANPTPSDVTPADPYGGLARVGDIGVAESPLRPAGKARFGATLIDVVTEGDLIPTGARLEVVTRHGNRVVVRGV